MYNVAICDEDIYHIQRIKNLLELAGLNSKNVRYFEYHSGNTFLDSLESIVSLDLLFLDIRISDITGNSVAKDFRTIFPHSILVFCSDMFYIDITSVNTAPFRYIIKTENDSSMLNKLTSIVSELNFIKHTPYIRGSWFNNYVKLHPNDILYISKGRNCSILHVVPNIRAHYCDEKTITKEKLSELYSSLKDYGFEYAHSSYIVNINHVIRVTPVMLELSDGTMLSVSRSKSSEFSKAFLNINYS